MSPQKAVPDCVQRALPLARITEIRATLYAALPKGPAEHKVLRHSCAAANSRAERDPAGRLTIGERHYYGDGACLHSARRHAVRRRRACDDRNLIATVRQSISVCLSNGLLK